ncbi:MAG: hypothetical protein M0D57_04710 [Sphingobacteriales bacterium JAD_PAG50586_3]|nr:MAG: hypothetical protein M0D57_04710 [Sphingobacteriales bacterium JAD_PAG50586_3]
MNISKNILDPRNYNVDYGGGKMPMNDIQTAMLMFDVVDSSKIANNASMIKIINGIHDSINAVLYDNHIWGEDSKHPDAENNDLLLIPTGDGYGIVLGYQHKDAYILEIARLLYADLYEKGILIRVGIVKANSLITFDANGNVNIFGFGILLATRVCNAAKNGQILVHNTLAESILQNRTVLGLSKIDFEYVAKHDMKFNCYNYFEENSFGVPA